jgi:hypothetical protein
MVAAAAIIASKALPPSLRTPKADSDASECGATAIPRIPHFGCIICISPIAVMSN